MFSGGKGFYRDFSHLVLNNNFVFADKLLFYFIVLAPFAVKKKVIF